MHFPPSGVDETIVAVVIGAAAFTIGLLGALAATAIVTMTRTAKQVRRLWTEIGESQNRIEAHWALVDQVLTRDPNAVRVNLDRPCNCCRCSGAHDPETEDDPAQDLA